jgi:ABC-type Fe3+-citrate transport system substrate-binding protein
VVRALLRDPPPRVGSELKRIAPLLVIAALVAGCGEKHHQSAAEKAKMENEFGQLQVNIGEATKGSGPADEPTMEQYTHDYVALIRKYADDLGDDEVKTRLTDEVTQVQPWCLVCGQILLSEAEKY